MVGTPAGAGLASDVPQPILSYTRSMVEPTGDWKFVGDYAIWTGKRIAPVEPYALLEQRGKGVLPVPKSSVRAIAHPIPGQTWFHVEGLFGFWMKADVDAVWIDAPGQNGHYYTMVVGGAETRPGSISAGWLCTSCGVIFNDKAYDVSRRRFQKFLDDMEARVVQFNEKPADRTCPGCGTVHTATYGFQRNQA